MNLILIKCYFIYLYAGSTFKKVYYDDLLERAVSKFVPADDLVVPYTATSLDDAESVIHVVKMSENDLRKQMVSGFYSDIELTKPTGTVTNELKKKKEKSKDLQNPKEQILYIQF